MTAREVKYYKGHLCGNDLTPKECERLLKIHEMQKRGLFFKDFKHLITDLTPENIVKIKKAKSAEGIENREGTLTDLQTLGVAYMAIAKRVLIGDSVGFGKTPQCAGLVNYLKLKQTDRPFRYIYFTKKTLVEKDQSELIRFTGEYVHQLKGETAFLKKELSKIDTEDLPYSFVGTHSVIKNPVFQEWVLVYMQKYQRFPFDLIIIDEASSVATVNENSEFTKPSRFLCKNAERVVLLNATPFESRLDSFRMQLELVDDTLLPTKNVFKRTFQKTRFNGYYTEYIDEYKNEEAFKEAIKLRFFARKRKENGGTMKNCSAKLIIVQKSREQSRLEKLTSMPQMVYDCPNTIDPNIEMNEKTTPKLKIIADLIENEGKNEETIMIYCRYKESQEGIIKLLKEKGYTCKRLNGETKREERLKIVDDFQNKRFRVLVTNVQEGLNFGNCNFMIFYSALPNPNKMVQVEGRMTRSFNIENKRVFLLATKGREYNNLKDTIAKRAHSSELFTGSDYSLILDLLRDNF